MYVGTFVRAYVHILSCIRMYVFVFVRVCVYSIASPYQRPVTNLIEQDFNL